MGLADKEWLKSGVHVHKCKPAFSFNDDEVKDVLTPIIYMSSRIRLDESTDFKRGDVIGDGLIFVAGIVLVEPEEFSIGSLVSGEFTALHDSFSSRSEAAAAAAASSLSGTLFIAWCVQKGLHVLVRNAISNL